MQDGGACISGCERPPPPPQIQKRRSNVATCLRLGSCTHLPSGESAREIIGMSTRSHAETDKSPPPVVSCVMRETISSKNGLSPPRRPADFSQTCSYTSIYTFAPSPTGSRLCGVHREGCIPHVFFLCCFFPCVSFPIPPLSPAVSSLSIPFPQLFPASLPPSVRPSHQAVCSKAQMHRERHPRRG